MQIIQKSVPDNINLRPGKREGSRSAETAFSRNRTIPISVG